MTEPKRYLTDFDLVKATIKFPLSTTFYNQVHDKFILQSSSLEYHFLLFYSSTSDFEALGYYDANASFP